MCFGFLFNIYFSLSRFGWFSTIGYNVLALGAVADFGAQNCQPALLLIRSTNVHLTTEPPIS
jgi:hypothetical protein